jgi:homoserine kinase
VLGGLVLTAMSGSGAVIARRVPAPPLAVAVAVPEFNLPTQAARAALPRLVPHADAAFNLARTALVVEALRCGDLALLGQVLEDRLHQPYRLPIIPGAIQALAAARQAGAAAAGISGAGPGLIAFGQGDLAPVAAAMEQAFCAAGLPVRSWLLSTTTLGVQVEQI